MDREKLIVQIADLGLACRQNDEEQIKLKCGTPGYAAPELLNKQSATTKVDIFSLGCVFFNLLTLAFVFQGRNVKEILHSNKYGDT
jgi:serine/threonine protein kinase